MKNLLLKITLLFLLSSCYRATEFSKTEVVFNSKGGEDTVEISHTRFFVSKFDKESPWYLNEEVRDKHYYYFNDWVTCIVPPSKTKIRIIAKPNTSNKRRSTILRIMTHHQGSFDLRIIQSK